MALRSVEQSSLAFNLGPRDPRAHVTALDVLGAGRIWWTVVFDGREQVDLPTPPSFVAEASSFEPSHGFVLDLEFERAPTVPWTADTEPSTVGTGSQSY